MVCILGFYKNLDGNLFSVQVYLHSVHSTHSTSLWWSQPCFQTALPLFPVVQSYLLLVQRVKLFLLSKSNPHTYDFITITTIIINIIMVIVVIINIIITTLLICLVELTISQGKSLSATYSNIPEQICWALQQTAPGLSWPNLDQWCWQLAAVTVNTWGKWFRQEI